MDLGLADMHVLVTGSTAGIGFAAARQFVRATTGAALRCDGGVIRAIA